MIENNENFQFQSVYHGSGASFDHFDTEHYGLSGEGSMSFGWGTYLTESEAIARDYADRQNGSGKKLDSLLKKYPDLYPHITPIYNHMSLGDSFEEAKKKYVGYLRENHIPGIRKITKSIEELKAEDFAELFKKNRNLYTVSIPDGKYLEWEKELTETESKHLVENYSNYFEYLTEDEKQEEAKQYVGKTGQEIYSHFENLLGSEKETSTFLHGIGYTGIKYPAGTIHGNGNGAYNYVIFDDADIEIKEHIQFQIQTEKNKSISSDFEPNIGDSEKLSDSILEGEPIKSISTDDFNYDGSNLKEFALEYIRNNPQGTANTKIGEVEISETGLRHSLSHTLYKNKLYSIPAIKDTLENGTYLGVIKDLDGKRQNNYYFAAPISIDDEKNVLFIRVKQVAGRDKAFYIHDVFTLDEIEKVTPYSGELNATQRSLRGATLAKSIIQDYEKNNIIQNNPLQFQQQNERNIALESQSAQKSIQEKSMENENNAYALVDENQAARIRLAHELKENMPMLTEKERAAAIAICEAGAASMGMGLSDYINQTFPNGVFGDIEKARNAAHQQGVEINGAVSTSVFGDSVRATIYASRTADFSTWCHELSHVWQAQLSGKLKNDAEKAFQVQNGDWQNSVYTFSDGSQDTSAEAFAYGFEDFLKHKAGEMATEDKKAIFEKFADYMSRTYNGIGENIKISDEIAKVYEAFVQLDDNVLAQAEKAVQMEKIAKIGIPEAQRQREAVRAMYEGTEKWLKAPNGKPTNLTEAQWVAVHTPNFKRWFGNWDYDENKKLKTVELDKNEVKFNHNNASEVEKWLKENLSGKSVVIDSSGAKVLFFNKGLTDSLKRHGEVQRNAYTVMEDLISKSEFFDFIKTDGQKKHNGISGQDIYYSVLKVDDRYYSVQFKFNVSEKYRTDSYKDHKITEIKATPLLYRGSKDAHAITDAASYDFTISQLTGGVKPNFSQVIDENGEPLVVYHGSRTGGGFDVFDGSTFHAKNYESADIFKQEADFVIQINGDRKISLDRWQAENLAYNLTGGDYEITEIATWKDLTDILKDTSDENKQYLQELVFDDFGIDVNDIERLTISENNIYQDFVNLRNPLVIDFNNEVWGQRRTVEQYFDKARENEHDGLLVKNIIEGGLTAETRNGENPIATTDYVTFSPNQIKSATDNNGNFDINNDSILFQSEKAETISAIFEPNIGDSEELSDSILNGKPIYEIDTSDFIINENEKYKLAARRYIQEHPQGTAHTKIGDIEINKSSLDHSFEHSTYEDKVHVIPALKDVLEQGTYLGVMKDFEGKRINNHYFAAPVKIDSETKIVFIRVREAAGDKSRFYIHDVFTSDEIEKVNSYSGTPVTLRAKTGADLYKSIIQDYEKNNIIQNNPLQFQLVGERSILRMAESEEKERILADLAAAKLMDEKYKNMDAAARASRIRFATGWEKSGDGRWKYELDDSTNRIKSGTLFQKMLTTQSQMLEQLTNTTTLTLEDILEAPELFNVFPFMKNVRVSFYSDPTAFRAVLTPEGIKINTQYLNEVDGEKGMKGVLAHEIQHIIQAVEYSSSNGLHGESIELLYNDMQNAIKAAGDRHYDFDLSSLQEGLDEYMHDFGEVEARNVARRISMSYNERRHNTLESTEDVARNLQFQTRGPASEKRNVELGEKYRNDFKFLNNVMSNGSGIVENKNVGEITFESGETGKSGYGIRHIIEQRCHKDRKNVDEITALMALVKEVSENGRITRENGRNIELQTENGIVSIVRKESDDKPYKWVLTGFDDFGNKEAATDAIQTVIAQYGYLPEYSSFRTQVGAVIASLNPNITQNEEKSINTQGEKTMAPEKQIIAEIGFADGEIKQYEDSKDFLNDLNAATKENAYDTSFRVYAESDELKQKAADVKLDNYDPIEAAERMHNGYEWNDVEHEAVQFTQSAEGRRLLKDAENGRLTMLDARDILDAVEKNGMTLRYDPLPNSYVVDGWTAADGEKLDNYVVSMSELKRLAGIEISENSQQNQIQEKKTARTPEEEQAYQEWLEMLDDNQQAEDRIERMQGVPPEEQKPLPEWQQRLNATINQAAEMDGVKDSIKTALYENAENFNAVSFSREGYERLFPDGVVQSPIEQIKFADNQFDVNDKDRFMLAAFQTLSNPDLIYSETENKDNLESKNYVKTFVFGVDEKSALDIVVKTIDGQKVMISAQKRSLDDLIEHIKQPDQLIFMSEQIKQTIDRHSPEEKQRLKDVLPNLRIVPTNEAYDKEKAITIAKDFSIEERANQAPAPKIQNENSVQSEKRNVAPEPVQKPEHDTAAQARDSYARKHPTDWQIYTKELTDKLNAVSEQIENYLEYGTLPENSRFILPNSPQFMQKIGSHDTQISLPVAVVKKAHETHGLTVNEIQDAVKKLYNPVVVFDSDKLKSENKVDSKLILTDSFTSSNKPVALAMNINSSVQFQKDGHRMNFEVQDIRSIHDRTLIAKNGTDLIKKWTQDGLCRYVDNKKISDWSTVAGIYFPIEALQSPKNNILTKTEIVNSFGKDIDAYEKNTQTKVSMEINELNDILKDALHDKAEELKTVAFTKENYDKLFPRSIVQSPIETVKLGANQFSKMEKKDRELFLLSAYQTLSNPDLIIREERNDGQSHNYAKSFVLDRKNKVIQDIVVSIDGENVSITSHPREINNFVNKIKTPDQLLFVSAEIRHLVEQRTQNAQAIVNPTMATVITAPTNKAYNRDSALSIVEKITDMPAVTREPESKEKSQSNKKYTPKEYLKYRSELFLKHLDQGNLPFMKGEQVGDDIIIKVKAVRNASNGRALTGFQQLMAQDIINTMVENKEIPRMNYEIITYEQAKEAGTFIKKGSPHFTIPVYNEKTNTVFNQLYYFKSGCNEPGKVDLLKLKIQRESFIGRERTKLEKAMKERDVPLDEKNKIFSSIAENHQAIIQYLNSVGKRKEAQEYKNNIPIEERAVFDRLEEKKEIELNEMLRKNAEYQHRIEEEEFKRQKENPNLFNARETSSYEDFLGKTMAAMSIGGIVVTSKSTIDTVRSTLTPVLKQSFDQYDYMKGFQIGEVANGKCKENLRETRNNSRENQEIKQTLDKALGFQQGGRNSPPDRSKEIDGYDR